MRVRRAADLFVGTLMIDEDLNDFPTPLIGKGLQMGNLFLGGQRTIRRGTGVNYSVGYHERFYHKFSFCQQNR